MIAHSWYKHHWVSPIELLPILFPHEHMRISHPCRDIYIARKRRTKIRLVWILWRFAVEKINVWWWFHPSLQLASNTPGFYWRRGVSCSSGRGWKKGFSKTCLSVVAVLYIDSIENFLFWMFSRWKSDTNTDIFCQQNTDFSLKLHKSDIPQENWIMASPLRLLRPHRPPRWWNSTGTTSVDLCSLTAKICWWSSHFPNDQFFDAG